MDRVIMHVDMDAFFASVELIARPDLRGRPVIVAGASGRGVVVAATYEARSFGVHAAMPVARAQRLCPSAVMIEPHRDAYTRVSAGVMELLRDVTPVVEQVSIDEAFLDLTGALKRLGPAAGIGQAVRQAVRQRFSITCSAGIGRSKSVAKIASEQAKPDGLLEVPAAATLDFLSPLPMSALWGLGPKTASVLAGLGMATIGDLASAPDGMVRRAIGQAAAAHLLALARGLDDAPVEPRQGEKSVGAEETFPHDLPWGEELSREVLRMADKAAHRLRQAELLCRTVAVKLRTADFKTHTRSRTLATPTDQTKVINEAAQGLARSLWRPGSNVRLVGVRLENLAARSGQPVQLTLDEDGWEGAVGSGIDRVADEIRRRFGDGSVTAGTLIP
ncbi:MAG: DNA polymerase IV [Bifidobacteriaceae bacterium]|jgi:DNA polymerase-4|nr:DNA polymerase IV [Bifidobacteriaceae bacterium]